MTKLLSRVNQNKNNFLLITYSLFILWAIIFILRSSILAVDNKRYFVLFDDAMISMRYAWNLSHGFGPVWNPGERVEGYSNPLMVFLMAIPSLMLNKSLSVLIIQVVGIITIGLIAYLSVKILESFPIPLINVNSLYILIFTCYPLVYWSLMGMESGILTLFIMLSVYYIVCIDQQNYKRNIGKAFGFLLLAYFTRTDAIIFLPFIYLYLIFKGKKFENKKKFYTTLLIFSSMLFIGIGIHLLFRYNYYGEFLPNTYTLKISGSNLIYRIKDGLSYIYFFSKTNIVLLGLTLIGVSIKPSLEKSFLFALILISIIYQIWTGGDPWPPYWRMMLPIFPLTFMLSLFGLNFIIERFLSVLNHFSPLINRLKYAFLFIGIAIIIILPNKPFLKQMTFQERPYQYYSNERNMNDAIAIINLAPPNASIGVFWAGTIPYYTDLYSIDFLGKSDTYITNLEPDYSGSTGWAGMVSVPGHNKYDLNYSIKEKKPTYIQGYIWGTQNLSEWVSQNYRVVDYKGVQINLLQEGE